MEMAIVALVVIVLVSALLGPVALWKLRGLRDLTRRLERLESEIVVLSRGLAPQAGLAASPAPQAMPDEAGPPPTPSRDMPATSGDFNPPPEAPETTKAARTSGGDAMKSGASATGSAPPERPVQAPAGRQPVSGKSMENTVGALWAVWVGGVALALGGVFLVRYSIEQGWLGPVARVAFGLLFASVLAAAGEWTRRRGAAYSFAGFERANVPAILTAAGTVAAFASVYAAYALYDLIPTAFAFIALGAVAVAGLAAALLHGVLLAALGLLASYSVPVLVSSDSPQPLALALYVFAVSCAAFGVARLRLWRWLAMLAAGGLFFWGLALVDIADAADRPVVFLYILASWGLVFFVFVASLYRPDPAQFVTMDRVATATLSAMLVLLLGAILVNEYDAATILVLALILAACFGAAWFYAACRYVILAALAVAVPGYLAWSLPLDQVMLFTDSIGSSHGISTPMLEFIRQKSETEFVWTGIGLAAIAALMGYYGTWKSASRALQAIGGAGLPIMLLAIAYVRMEMFQSSFFFGGLALALGLIIGTAANHFYDRLPAPLAAREEAISAYAIAAIAAIALAVGFVFERGALTIALALVVPATAFVHARRPLAALRPVAVVFALLWIARIAWDPSIVGDDLGTTPIFNWLLYGYGVPTAGFALSAYLLGLERRDIWLEIMEAISIASLAATAALVGLHAIDPQGVFTPIDSLAEAAILPLVSGGISLGLLRISRTRSSKVMNFAASLLGYGGMAAAALGLFITCNPLLSGESIGPGLIFNSLTFAYLAPAALYALLALASLGKRPMLYSGAAGGLGFLLFAAWVTLSIRHAFHPQALDLGVTGNSELYVYSIVWLIIGLIVLIAGIWSGLRPVRLLSALILVGVTAKAFLFDMASLTGVLRALSFIGLGIVLIGIGLIYQRLLRQPVPMPENGEAPSGQAE